VISLDFTHMIVVCQHVFLPMIKQVGIKVQKQAGVVHDIKTINFYIHDYYCAYHNGREKHSKDILFYMLKIFNKSKDHS